jgi:hypothetical protein
LVYLNADESHYGRTESEQVRGDPQHSSQAQQSRHRRRSQEDQTAAKAGEQLGLSRTVCTAVDNLPLSQSFESAAKAPLAAATSTSSQPVEESKSNPEKEASEESASAPSHYEPKNPQAVIDTATEMLLSSSSALHGCSKADAQRIVSVLDSALPPAADGDSGDFTDGLHKLVFSLQVI